MSYEYKGSNTPAEQTSLAGGETNEEEKLRQAKKSELQKKYRQLSIMLVSIIIVSFSLLIAQVNATPQEPIEVTVDNWSNYFVISKEIVDTSIVLEDAALYSMETSYTIRLKDYYVNYLDPKDTSKVSFSLTYEECMGLFEMDYTNLTYKEPDSFSAVGSRAANVVVEYPQPMNSESNIVYSTSILGGGEPDDNIGIGYTGRNFTVTDVSGTLYFKADR